MSRSIDVDLHNSTTISELKQLLADQGRWSKSDSLIHRAKRVYDGQTLEELGVISGDVMTCITRLSSPSWNFGGLPPALFSDFKICSSETPWLPCSQWSVAKQVDTSHMVALAGKHVSFVWAYSRALWEESVTPLTVCLLNATTQELVPCLITCETIR